VSYKRRLSRTYVHVSWAFFSCYNTGYLISCKPDLYAVNSRHPSGSRCHRSCLASLRPSPVCCTSVCRRRSVTFCRTLWSRRSSLDDVPPRNEGQLTFSAALNYTVIIIIKPSHRIFTEFLRFHRILLNLALASDKRTNMAYIGPV